MNLQKYQDLWNTVSINPDKVQSAGKISASILSNWAKYTAVKKDTGVPEYVTGMIHYRESDLDFNTWLANGDPLFHQGRPAKTVHVPAGLGPVTNWSDGAVLSFHHQGFDRIQDWSLPNALFEIECYNGRGYMARDLNSPYLWAGTNHYVKGKFVADGIYNSDTIDAQLGCVPILLALKAHGVDLKEQAQVHEQSIQAT